MRLDLFRVFIRIRIHPLGIRKRDARDHKEFRVKRLRCDHGIALELARARRRLPEVGLADDLPRVDKADDLERFVPERLLPRHVRLFRKGDRVAQRVFPFKEARQRNLVVPLREAAAYNLILRKLVRPGKDTEALKRALHDGILQISILDTACARDPVDGRAVFLVNPIVSQNRDVRHIELFKISPPRRAHVRPSDL